MRTSNYYPLGALLGFTLLLSAGCGDSTAVAREALGAIEVRVTTTFGTDDLSDRDSFPIRRVVYNLGVDGGTGPLIVYNGSARLYGVPTRTHSVKLYGLPYNCSVSSENPARVDVSPVNLVGSAQFSVSCVAPQDGGWDY
jgi:hypothetical protein